MKPCKCLIHYKSGKISYGKLSTPRDLKSWEVLLEAARTRRFTPVLELEADAVNGVIPRVFYHQYCRNRFIQKPLLSSICPKTDAEHNSDHEQNLENVSCSEADQEMPGSDDDLKCEQVEECSAEAQSTTQQSSELNSNHNVGESGSFNSIHNCKKRRLSGDPQSQRSLRVENLLCHAIKLVNLIATNDNQILNFTQLECLMIHSTFKLSNSFHECCSRI